MGMNFEVSGMKIINIEDGHEVLGPGDENQITLSLENDRTYLQ
jgi:hypothetical protein